MQLPRYRPILGGRESERLPTNLREIESILSLSASSIERYLADLDRAIINVAYAAAPAMADVVLAGSGITVTDNGDGTITISQGAGAVTGSAAAGQVTYWSGASTLTGGANFTFTDGASGSTSLLTLKNASNTASSHAGIHLICGGSSGGSPYIKFDPENGGQTFWLSSDGTDGNRFKIQLGGLTGTQLVSIDPSTFGIGLGYEMDPSSGYDVLMGNTFGNTSVDVGVYSPSHEAHLDILSAGGYSSRIRMFSGGSSNPWAFGPDASDTRAFKFDLGSVIGGDTKLKISTTGIITVPTVTDASSISTGAFIVSGGVGIAKKLYIGGTLDVAGSSNFQLPITAYYYTAANSVGAYVTSLTTPVVYATSAAGSAPFNEAGHMVISPRIAGAVRDVLIVPAASHISVRISGSLITTFYDVSVFGDTTDASAVGTASVTLAGGLGIAKKLYLGDDLYLATGKAYRVNGVQVLTNQQAGLGANIAAATAGAAYTATEQAMLQALNDKMVALEPMLKTHGLVAT
jgi:hypothetical protein